jgi:large subunit ribosomal protein L10
MAKKRAEKKKIIQNLTLLLKKVPSFYWVDFRGLKATDEVALRKKLREQNIGYQVVKKTLLFKAFQENKLEIPVDAFDGQIALSYSYEDELSPLKALENYINKEKIPLRILGGFSQGKYLTADEVKKLAQLPSRKELLGQLVFTLQYPYFSFIKICQAHLQKFLIVLDKISQKKLKAKKTIIINS